MTAIFSKLLGRLPIGWLQLTHNKGRLFAAVAGITFANLLVFVQLGILGGMNSAIIASYKLFDADIMISATDANTFTEGGNVPRQLMYRALSARGIQTATPVYVTITNWAMQDGTIANIQVIGIDPEAASFMAPEMTDQVNTLRLLDTIILDTKTRGIDGSKFDGITINNPFRLELAGRTLTGIGTIETGGMFNADGTAIVSDETFLKLFGRRSATAPDHILAKITSDSGSTRALAELSSIIPPQEARVRSLEEAGRSDQIYQTTQRPVGLVFGFGVVMGIIVGLVIVYQILSTDVADHLREYATFKAMGYPQSFFLGIVFEEAFFLAIMGFIPGFLLSWAAHIGLATATGLPIAMNPTRSIIVLLGTIVACSISGAIATRRLAGADPADLF